MNLAILLKPRCVQVGKGRAGMKSWVSTGLLVTVSHSAMQWLLGRTARTAWNVKTSHTFCRGALGFVVTWSI